ncbi:hypothetical protein [Pseudomonas coronafaciens]|uniref:hypothetical protein n=1 Tax=Pseudomonas coronafaciens TaxID=53409 RepID=UPI000F3D1E21|nr:hypothetical protein [Pseudomonas coronafaciens]RMS10656.1 hypothetical protein ALP71_00423 [Pseudomonas coronafaciens pv. garcae]
MEIEQETLTVEIRDSLGVLLWARSAIGGVTSSSYHKEGTLQLVKVSLEKALSQCEGELTISNDVDGVRDSCAATSDVDGDVPITCAGHNNLRG